MWLLGLYIKISPGEPQPGFEPTVRYTTSQYASLRLVVFSRRGYMLSMMGKVAHAATGYGCDTREQHTSFSPTHGFAAVLVLAGQGRHTLSVY